MIKHHIEHKILVLVVGPAAIRGEHRPYFLVKHPGGAAALSYWGERKAHILK